MRKSLVLILFTLIYGLLQAQQSVLPVDWRQHNLVKYNDNVFNPALSFVRNEHMNLSLWGRIQWVNVDDSPRTYFINYNGRAGEKSGAGLALFQHNIGLFTDSGLMANYARGIQLARNSWLTFGINVIASRRGLNEANFITPEPDPSILEGKDDFLLALMPGINLTINKFNIGISSENLFDYNLSSSAQQTDFADKIFMGYASYDFSIGNNVGSWKNSILRTTVYTKTIPDQDLQYGLNALIDVPDYGWIQAGYNNFYGISGGIGAKVSRGISVGFVIETGTQNTNRAFGATYEITAAIEFGKVNTTDEPLAFKEGPTPRRRRSVNTDETQSLSETIAVEKELPIDNNTVKAVTELVPENKQENMETVTEKTLQDSPETSKTNTKRSRRRAVVANENAMKPTTDKKATVSNESSVSKEVKSEKALVFDPDEITDVTADVRTDNKGKDSLNFDNIQQMEIKELESYAIDKNTDEKVLKGLFKEEVENTRYKAVERIEGVEYGFYLVVNVFSQKKYFDLFKRLLTAQGLDPKSFYNTDNNYYYVYLKKYDKLSEVEKDRRSDYNGRYTGETWILWVRKN
jgi:type IX secretion system PorP/SprF family membrane protein